MRVPCALALTCATLAAVGWPEPMRAQAGEAGRTHELRVGHPAFAAPRGAPEVVVHAPPGFRTDRPYGVVVFLHGWHGCVRVLEGDGPTACRPGGEAEPGWGLGRAHDAAGTNSLLVLPQLAFLARDGSAGRLRRPGQARALLEETLAATVDPGGDGPTPSRVVLVAHSAGYESALAILRHGGLRRPETTDVVLMDALYAGTRAFGEWLIGQPGRKLVSIYTSRTAAPGRESRRLSQWIRRRHPEVSRRVLRTGWSSGDVGGARLVVAASAARHRDVPAVHLAATLRALGLPLRSP